MLSFATEFPIRDGRTSTDFFKSVEKWLLGSPHTALRQESLDDLLLNDEFVVEGTAERFESVRVATSNSEAASVRYAKRDASFEWVTSIVMAANDGRNWVSIRTSCESQHPSARVPRAKKPVLVRTLLTDLGGGQDGVLAVQGRPYRLSDADIDVAARLIDARCSCRMPIVYVSAHFISGYVVDCGRLAQSLEGLAHVVVEPNRPFSVRLKDEVESQNVYGGTVGIYWPDGGGRRSFFLGPEFQSEEDIESAIVDEITDALTNRRPLVWCTWAAVQEAASKKAYQALKDAGSTSLQDYIDNFDSEIKTKDAALADAEREINRLHAELRKYEAKVNKGAGIVVKTGREQDLWPNEIAEILRDAIEGADNHVANDSRRRHVLKAICDANPLGDGSKRRREKLKELLRDYRSMDAHTRKGLDELGFAVSEDGRHFKLMYQGDDRYTFTLPKSGSDHRGGLNAANDIGRLLF